MTSTDAASASITRSASLRLRAAVGVGQAVEWYDYGIYGYFAVFLAPVFFPATNPTASLLVALSGFLLTFITRPIGALLVGHYADRAGRRNALAITIIGASLCSALIGVLPGYAAIGLAAPILILLLRVLLGMTAGGEVPAAGSMVIEHSDPSRRARSTAWVQMGGSAGAILALLVSTVTTALVPASAMAEWGWRIPFLIALPLGVVGYIIRRTLEETPEFAKLQTPSRDVSGENPSVARVPLAQVFKNPVYVRRMVTIIGVYLVHLFAFYVFLTYVPTYLMTTLKLGASISFLSGLMAQCFLLVLIPLFARLADKVGRKPLIFAAQALFLVLPIPLFLMMSTGSFPLIVLSLILIIVPISLYQAIQNPVMLELMPTQARVSGAGVAYALSTALFGGTAPLLAVWLYGLTGTAVAVAGVVSLGAIVSFLFTIKLPETRNWTLN